MIHFACRDAAALARFWSEVLELPVDDGASRDLAMINVTHDHGPITWIFQRGDEIPAGVNRIAIDLTSEDWEAQADRFVAAGAARLSAHNVGGVRWVELTDIEGNLFRIFAPRADDSA
ncbi:MAG TPA: VOC family protein [Pilimelia sp.]|nr:VOC family protein [Pilimelia sp.]